MSITRENNPTLPPGEEDMLEVDDRELKKAGISRPEYFKLFLVFSKDRLDWILFADCEQGYLKNSIKLADLVKELVKQRWPENGPRWIRNLLNGKVPYSQATTVLTILEKDNCELIDLWFTTDTNQPCYRRGDGFYTLDDVNQGSTARHRNGKKYEIFTDGEPKEVIQKPTSGDSATYISSPPTEDTIKSDALQRLGRFWQRAGAEKEKTRSKFKGVLKAFEELPPEMRTKAEQSGQFDTEELKAQYESRPSFTMTEEIAHQEQLDAASLLSTESTQEMNESIFKGSPKDPTSERQAVDADEEENKAALIFQANYRKAEETRKLDAARIKAGLAAERKAAAQAEKKREHIEDLRKLVPDLEKDLEAATVAHAQSAINGLQRQLKNAKANIAAFDKEHAVSLQDAVTQVVVREFKTPRDILDTDSQGDGSPTTVNQRGQSPLDEARRAVTQTSGVNLVTRNGNKENQEGVNMDGVLEGASERMVAIERKDGRPEMKYGAMPDLILLSRMIIDMGDRDAQIDEWSTTNACFMVDGQPEGDVAIYIDDDGNRIEVQHASAYPELEVDEDLETSVDLDPEDDGKLKGDLAGDEPPLPETEDELDADTKDGTAGELDTDGGEDKLKDDAPAAFAEAAKSLEEQDGFATNAQAATAASEASEPELTEGEKPEATKAEPESKPEAKAKKPEPNMHRIGVISKGRVKEEELDLNKVNMAQLNDPDDDLATVFVDKDDNVHPRIDLVHPKNKVDVRLLTLGSDEYKARLKSQKEAKSEESKTGGTVKVTPRAKTEETKPTKVTAVPKAPGSDPKHRGMAPETKGKEPKSDSGDTKETAIKKVPVAIGEVDPDVKAESEAKKAESDAKPLPSEAEVAKAKAAAKSDDQDGSDNAPSGPRFAKLRGWASSARNGVGSALAGVPAAVKNHKKKSAGVLVLLALLLTAGLWPSSSNNPPVITEQASSSHAAAHEGETVTLKLTAKGDEITVKWSQTQGTKVKLTEDEFSANFTAPSTLGVLAFKATVTDKSDVAVVSSEVVIDIVEKPEPEGTIDIVERPEPEGTEPEGTEPEGTKPALDSEAVDLSKKLGRPEGTRTAMRSDFDELGVEGADRFNILESEMKLDNENKVALPQYMGVPGNSNLEIHRAHMVIHTDINHEGTDEYKLLPQAGGKLVTSGVDSKGRVMVIFHVSVRKDLIDQVPELPKAQGGGGWTVRFTKYERPDLRE